MHKSLNPFAATFFLKRFIRNRRENPDTAKEEKEVAAAEQGPVFKF
jgi:hypothetical protein